MSERTVARILGVAVALTLATWALLSALIDTRHASASPCPDVEVVFARGTNEPPGVGGVGQAFIDSLRAQARGRSVGIYAVNYPATDDFVRSSLAGAGDARTHVQSTVANCPNTRMVLGGYSQGAAVTGFTTADAVPPGVPALAVPAPMPPEVAGHVAAVALFGKPSAPFLQSYGAPAIVIGPLYQPKTIDLCAQGDTICDGTPGGGPTAAHVLYPVNGMVAQAASFVAGRL
jgi:hypothetical protein